MWGPSGEALMDEVREFGINNKDHQVDMNECCMWTGTQATQQTSCGEDGCPPRWVSGAVARKLDMLRPPGPKHVC